MLQFPQLIRAFMLLAICAAASTTLAAPKYEIDARYLGLYESNIYRAYLDTQAVPAQLNEVKARFSLTLPQSEKMTHSLEAYTNLDLYLDHSNRNRTTFGFAYRPVLRYARRASLHLDLDISRRNRDLFSDAGEFLNRNLAKTLASAKATHRFTLGRLRTEQSLEIADHNYDNSYDSSTGLQLASYDYQYLMGAGSLRLRLQQHISLEGELSYEKRNYDERKTYPIDKGPVKGYGVIREFKEWNSALILRTDISRSMEIDLEVGYTDRTDNFENFYGYYQWNYRLNSTIHLGNRDELKIGFDYRTRDYPNYWTRNTGRTGRVSIDYATLEIENTYILSSRLDLIAYCRNFNKVSNERYVEGVAVPSYDYADLSIGLGLAYQL